MKKFILLLGLIVAMSAPCQLARAEEIKLGGIFERFPIKEGYFLDLKGNDGFNILGIEAFKKSGFSANLAYIGSDAAGITLDYDLSGLPLENAPILKYLEYLSVGYGVAYRTITLTDVDDNPDSDNRLLHGPLIYVKLRF